MKKPDNSFISITPLFVFVFLFFCSAIFLSQPISALFSCLLAIIYAVIFTFGKDIPFNKRIDLFISGSAHPTAIATCYILFFSAIFTYTLNIIGGTQAAVNIGMGLIPSQFLLPGFFFIVSLFAVAIGSSMGAIAAFLPIGLGMGEQLLVNPSLICGIVVGGAMLGDNLSIISDTTIAATQTTGCHMKDKFKENSLLVLPAFIATMVILFYLNHFIPTPLINPVLPSINLSHVLPITPYGAVFILALCNIDVLAVLVVGILMAMGIGIWQGTFTFLQSTSVLVDGFAYNSSIQEVLMLVLFVAGLSYIVEYNGGIQYLLNMFSHHIRSKARAEISIALLVFLVNMAVAINTIAILVTGPVAKHIADQFDIPKKRVASLIDIVACICQGILPYAPQLLLAASLAKVSSISIMPYLHYQWFVAVVTAASIGKTYVQEKQRLSL